MKCTYILSALILLFLTIISFIQPTGATNGRSSHNIHDTFLVSSSRYRKQHAQRYTNLVPALQEHHQNSIHQIVRQLRQQRSQPPPPLRPRFLQATNATVVPSTSPPLAPTVCNSTTGLVNFNDDDLNSNLFGTPTDIFDSMCMCEEGKSFFFVLTISSNYFELRS
jgi:hypothetical protein